MIRIKQTIVASLICILMTPTLAFASEGQTSKYLINTSEEEVIEETIETKSKYLTNDDVSEEAEETIEPQTSKYVKNSGSYKSSEEDSSQTIFEPTMDLDEVKRGYVSCDILNFRETPEMVTKENIIGKLYRYETVEVVGTVDEWLQVITADNEEGYVHSDYIVYITDIEDSSELAEVREEVIEYAKEYLGLQYVYGGNSLETGTDCSGFTKLVLEEFGYSINRSSIDQVKNGVYVSKDEILPGDLIFYGNGYVQHVAMYIGNGQVIHAGNESTGVFINDAYNDWNKPFITIRRIIID